MILFASVMSMADWTPPHRRVLLRRAPPCFQCRPTPRLPAMPVSPRMLITSL